MSRGLYGLTSIYARRQASDIFQNDPFKIQSYNFRYAERPTYSMQAYRRPEPTQPKPPAFETYYKNPKFITRMSHNAAVTPASTAFADHRRRQFLHGFNYMPTMPTSKVNSISSRETPQHRSQLGSSLPTAVSKLPLLRTCCNLDEYRAIRRDHSVTSLRQSASSSKSTQACASGSSLNSRNFSISTFERSPKHSASCSSGCAVNINISGRETQAQQDNRLSMQIETDNNTNNFKEPAPNPSSDIFVIDKKLSKFNFPIAHERDVSLAVREQGAANQVRQQELQKEQQLMQLHAQERQLFRQLERLRDRDQLQELQAKRERHIQRELECKSQKPKPMRTMPLTTSAGTAAPVMTSHLKRLASKERLPGMVPFYIRQPTASSSPQAVRTGRITQEVQLPISPAPSAAPPCITLERRNSASSNNNANVCGSVSNASLRRLANPRPSERKLLNLNVNGMPLDYNQPIHTRLNNMPIRITTSQPAYEDRQFSLNKVRMRNTPITGGSEQGGSRSCSSRLEEWATRPYNVSINVYADNLRTKRS